MVSLGRDHVRKRIQTVLGGYFALFVASATAFHFGAEFLGKGLAFPLIILSGWAFVGHVVTMDDDFPGGWSNPRGTRAIWRSSLAVLVLKAVLFGASIWLLEKEW